MTTLSSIAENIETGKRLMSIRASKELSQGEFGELLGISRTAYINYEKGIREIPVSIQRLLASKLDIDPTWLVLGVGTKRLSVASYEIDEDLLAHIEHKLRNWLSKNAKSLPSKEHARVLAVCYKHFAHDNNVDDLAIDLVLKMVA